MQLVCNHVPILDGRSMKTSPSLIGGCGAHVIPSSVPVHFLFNRAKITWTETGFGADSSNGHRLFYSWPSFPGENDAGNRNLTNLWRNSGGFRSLPMWHFYLADWLRLRGTIVLKRKEFWEQDSLNFTVEQDYVWCLWADIDAGICVTSEISFQREFDCWNGVVSHADLRQEIYKES